MNKAKYVIALFWLLISFVSHAQSVMQMNLDEFYKQYNTQEYGRKIVGQSVVGGSPYEKEEFIPGMIVMKSGLHYIGIPLRYNIYSDEVEYSFRDRGVFVIGLSEIIDSVYIGDEKFIHGHFRSGSKNVEGYFRILTERSPALLQKMNVSIKPAESAQAYKDFVPPKFERIRDEFFLAVSPGELVRLNDKNDLPAIFNDYISEIKQFIKSNKLKFSKPDDLVKLLEYYYSLTSG